MCKCKYKINYYNYESKHIEEYKCDRHHVINSDYCIFHDPNYLHGHEDEVRDEFYKLIIHVIMKKSQLYCIGFYLPSFNIEDLYREGLDIEFKKSVYFTETKFKDVAFYKTTFCSTVDFSRSIFNSVTFITTKFYKITNFRRAEFREKVEFRDVEFFDEVDLDGSKFYKEVLFVLVIFYEETRFSEAVFLGNVIFDTVRFYKETRFSSIKFRGEETFFWEIEFYGKVDFLGTKFTNAVFSYIKFYTDASFLKTEFSKAYFENIESSNLIDFSDAKFYRLEDIVFNNCDKPSIISVYRYYKCNI